MQASRRAVNEDNLAAGAAVNVTLTVPTEPREEINFHNIWGSVSCEPQDAAVNAQGTWVLYVIRFGQPLVTFTDANFNLEGRNQQIIACGVFSAVNEMPWTSEPIHPKTSRNLGPGDILVLTAVVTGITGGLASTRVMLCANTVRK